MMSFYITAAVLCVLLSAFFSASEMSLSSANRLRLGSMSDGGSRSAAIALALYDRFDDALSAILIGNNFVNIVLSSLGSLIAISAFGEQYIWLATVIVTVTVIICGETVPKIIAKKNANRLLPTFAPFLWALTTVFKPLTLAVVAAVHALTNRMNGDEPDAESDTVVEELQSIIETAEDEDVIDEDRSELLRSALDFDEISVSEVMTARVDTDMVNIDDDWEQIYETLCASSHSRIPVYQGSVDNVVGVLLQNRFFKAMIDTERPAVRGMLMQPCFLYKSTKLPDALERLRRAGQHLAVVTDEYGGVCGIVTMEDVLEQLVGDIWDETDEIAPDMVERTDGSFELNGDMSIGAFMELLDLDEDSFETESSTVGGWALERFGTFPEAGEQTVWQNLTVTILKMDGLRVEKLLVTPAAPTEDD